jgi:hypothetical protein
MRFLALPFARGVAIIVPMNTSLSTKNLLCSLPLLLSLAACGSPSPEAASETTDAGVAALDAGATVADAAPVKPGAPDITGRWKSACTPMSATQGFVLDFDIAKSTWGVDYTVFADSACSTKFITVRIEGPYELGAASRSVAGAFDAKFGFTKKTVTPHLAAAADFLASANGCGTSGFTAGQAKDISAAGCAGLGQQPIAACSADYDIAKLEGDVLTFGSRPADNNMCSPDKRPTSLAQVSSKRQ